MNPDPNQPIQPEQPVPPQAPIEPTVAPAPIVAEPVVLATPEAPNPFGAAPVNTDAPTVPTPFAAAAPAGPIGSAPVAATAAPAPGGGGMFKNKKKLIILIASVVGALVVLAIAAVVVIGLFSVSKADYRSAQDAFNTVSSSYSKLNLSASTLQYNNTSSTTDVQFTNDIESARTAVKNFQADSAKFGDSKAVKVGEGKTLFATYKEKTDAYVAYALESITSQEKVRPALKICSDSSSDSTTILAECSAALDKVTDVPNADYKQYISVMQVQYKELLSLTTQINALTDRYGKDYEQYKVLRDKTYVVQDKVRAASKDFSSNASKHADDIDPSVAANALGTYLAKQATN
jgi:hypothetical protein